MIAPATRPAIMPENVPANIHIRKKVAPTSIRMSCLSILLRPNLSSRNRTPHAAMIPVRNIIYLLYLTDIAVT